MVQIHEVQGRQLFDHYEDVLLSVTGDQRWTQDKAKKFVNGNKVQYSTLGDKTMA